MIRSYHPSDKESLIDILQLNVPKYFDAAEVNEFINYLALKSDTYLIIEHENKIVGGVGYEIRESDRSGRINWIFLHPGYSGIGLGIQAVEHCLAILRSDAAVKKLTIRTSQLVSQFFEKFGYQLIKVEKDYWAKGLDLYLMEQELIR
jgi:N-acetylglutamate synthase-like GNAT family acetyltransferase